MIKKITGILICIGLVITILPASGIVNFGTDYNSQIVNDNNSPTLQNLKNMIGSLGRANLPPNQPTNESPANGSVDVYFNMNLSWTGGDPDGDPVTYVVFFGTNSSPPMVSNNQSETTYDPGIMNFNTTYFWKIIAWDNQSAYNESPLWEFTTEASPPPNNPPTFSGESPSNGSTDVSIDTSSVSVTIEDPDGDTFNWSIETSPDIGSNSGTGENNGTKTCSISGLDYSTTYTWFVNATDEEDSTNESFIFTTEASPPLNNPPYQPSNPIPANGSTGERRDVDLSWTGGDPDGDPVTYVVFFGTNSTPSIVSNNQSETTYDPGILDDNTTYYWKIIAWDNQSAHNESPLWNFTTGINHPPNMPGHETPKNESVDINIQVNLGWDCGDIDPGDIVTYDVYFGDVTPPPQVASNISETTYDLWTLNISTTYYWKIIAWDNIGASTEGPLWHFTTMDNTPPWPPNMSRGPSCGGPGVNLTFEAITSDPENDKVSYMWDWGDGNFSDWIGPLGITEPCEAIHMWNSTGEYSIRIKAKDIHDAESDWSEPHNITIARQIEIENLKPGHIYFRIFTFDKSYLYLHFLSVLGVTGVLTTDSGLYLNATVTDCVDAVNFSAFQILWNIYFSAWDRDMSDGADAYIPLDFGLYRIIARAYDVDDNLIDIYTVNFLILFNRGGGTGGKIGAARQTIVNKLLK